MIEQRKEPIIPEPVASLGRYNGRTTRNLDVRFRRDLVHLMESIRVNILKTFHIWERWCDCYDREVNEPLYPFQIRKLSNIINGMSSNDPPKIGILNFLGVDSL